MAAKWRPARVDHPDGSHSHVNIWWDAAAQGNFLVTRRDIDRSCKECDCWAVKLTARLAERAPLEGF